jgi:hypothetical protein
MHANILSQAIKESSQNIFIKITLKLFFENSFSYPHSFSKKYCVCIYMYDNECSDDDSRFSPDVFLKDKNLLKKKIGGRPLLSPKLAMQRIQVFRIKIFYVHSKNEHNYYGSKEISKEISKEEGCKEVFS